MKWETFILQKRPPRHPGDRFWDGVKTETACNSVRKDTEIGLLRTQEADYQGSKTKR